jgi:DNA-binding HxlR family transcriptional regulator
MAPKSSVTQKNQNHNSMCPIIGAIRTIATESRLLVVRHLFSGPRGFNELWRESGINSKTLSLTLKYLEQQKIVKRDIVSTRPFTVQYSLTTSGMELKPALKEFGEWGSRWLPQLNAAKVRIKHC